MSDIGVSMSLALSIPLQLIGATVLKSFADLDDQVTKAFSRIRGAGEGVKVALQEAAVGLSQQTATSAVDLAKGLDLLTASGFSAKGAIEALNIANAHSISGDIEMTKAVSDLVSIMSALDLRTGDATKDMMMMRRVSDVLTSAADATQSSVEEFGDALVRATPSMKQANVSLEEGVAVLAAYAQRGIVGARAGDQLRIMLRDVGRVAIKNADEWAKFGVSVFDASGDMRNVADIIGDLQSKFKSFGGDTEAMTKAIINLGFQFRSIEATRALLGAETNIREFQKQFESAFGATMEKYNVRMRSFGNQMRILGNQIKAVGFEIAQIMVPAVLALNTKIQQGLVWWRGLATQTKVQMVLWGGVAAAMGPVLILSGLMVRAVGLLANVLIASVTGMVSFIRTSITLGVRLVQMTLALHTLRLAHITAAGAAIVSWIATLGPVALVVAAVGGIIGLIVGRDGLMEAFQGMKVWAGDAFKWIEERARSALGVTNEEIDKLTKSLSGAGGAGLGGLDLGLGTARGAAIAGGGLGGGFIAFNMAAMESAMTNGVANGLDMAGFDVSTFKKGIETEASEVDPSFFEEEDKKRKEGQELRGFRATELGSEEEYSARVTGQMLIARIQEKQLHEQKEIRKSSDRNTVELRRIDQKLENMQIIEFLEANVT